MTAPRFAVGDHVLRLLAGVPMRLRVTGVTPDRVVCGAWEFDPATGAEIDADLGWGPPPLRTGSSIRLTVPPDYEVERQPDGCVVLVPPPDVTIFSVPGEGWLVTDNYMRGRSWDSEADAHAACAEYLRTVLP